MLTFEGLTKEEFIEYFNNNDTLEFNNFYECSFDGSTVSVWNIYEHNDISCYDIDEFFDCYAD